MWSAASLHWFSHRFFSVTKVWIFVCEMNKMARDDSKK